MGHPRQDGQHDADLQMALLPVGEMRGELLGPAARTLRTAATIGAVVDPDLLMEVLNLHPVDLFAHLEAGVKALFLDEGAGAFTFHHELVRDALAAGLTGPWRAHVHRRPTPSGSPTMLGLAETSRRPCRH